MTKTKKFQKGKNKAARKVYVVGTPGKSMGLVCDISPWWMHARRLGRSGSKQSAAMMVVRLAESNEDFLFHIGPTSELEDYHDLGRRRCVVREVPAETTLAVARFDEEIAELEERAASLRKKKQAYLTRQARDGKPVVVTEKDRTCYVSE